MLPRLLPEDEKFSMVTHAKVAPKANPGTVARAAAPAVAAPKARKPRLLCPSRVNPPSFMQNRSASGRSWRRPPAGNRYRMLREQGAAGLTGRGRGDHTSARPEENDAGGEPTDTDDFRNQVESRYRIEAKQDQHQPAERWEDSQRQPANK